MKLYQKAFGEGFVFTKFYPLPTLIATRLAIVLKNLKKIL